METSLFEEIASSLTVKSICGRLSPDVYSDMTIGSLENYFDVDSDPYLDPWNNPSRVIDDDGHIVGMLWFEDIVDEDDGAFIGDIMTKVEPYEILSSTTTILDAVELFGKRNHHFYVTHINDVVGVLRYRDLLHPLGRLAFLALALEIEDQAMRFCQFRPIREHCWHSLSENRRSKAIELFKQRYKRAPRPEKDAHRLIECTNLVDKATMIWKQKLIGQARRSEVLGFFENLRTVRDRCAHPGGESYPLPQDKLADFVKSAKSIRTSLHESMRTMGVGPNRNMETI
jgi:CBS domain